DILTRTSNALYTLTLPPPAGPIVISRTHPDQNSWSNAEAATFEWNGISEDQGFSYTLNALPVDVPDNISEGLRTRTAYERLPDGAHYFHVKALRGGVWGGTTHYAIRVDRTPPAEFKILVSPAARTSNRRPILEFETTDTASGISHYELKIVNLSQKEKADATPFFIEAASPHSENLEPSKYEVIVRAFDRAENFSQANVRLAVVTPLFQIFRENGLCLVGTAGSSRCLAWPVAALFGAILLALLAYLTYLGVHSHRRIEEHLSRGALAHPSLAEKVRTLREKRGEYRRAGNPTKTVSGIVFFLVAGAILMGTPAGAQIPQEAFRPNADPPIVTLFPRTLANDEILYIGGRSGTPRAEVIVNLQHTESGSTRTETTATDMSGAWFYTFPNFLPSGEYHVWTQLKAGEELSQPSPQLALTVAPTAIQIGDRRVSFAQVYLVLFVAFALAFFALLATTLYHFRHFRRKRARLEREIHEAEDALRRGFSLLKRDIEAELALMHRVKLNKDITAEERSRETQVLKDLDWVHEHVGKEIWEIEEAEKAL
ncbi:MAG: hypothetical protein HY436_01745, partial [Candidatus Liptonbacteria bacterium]|nr:hypothetical protein [Candidatus Liptonbacteria bacterium]